MTLAGKVVAITGAFGALGSAVVRAALAEGASVAAIDRAPEPHDRSTLGAAQIYGGVDLGDAADADRTMATIVAQFGGLDALVNIAGTFRWETIGDGSLDTWDFLYQTNLRTAVAASKAALPALIERRGRIVNIGAAGAARGELGKGAYAASKAGVARLTESLAEELKDRGVTVNAVLPSIIDTPANRADMPKSDFSRWVKPEQLADVIVFLLSEKASAVNGALIPVLGRV